MDGSKSRIASVFLGVIFIGCQPSATPPDLLKTQRESLEKAKAVDGQLQKKAEEDRKAIDDAQR